MAWGSPQLLTGKVAAVTGGLAGIGRAIVLDFLRHGAAVIVNDLEGSNYAVQVQALVEEAGSISSPPRLDFCPGDVSDQQTAVRIVDKAVAVFGQLDIFVANAGACKFADFLEQVDVFIKANCSIEKSLFDSTLQVNLSGAFYCTQAAARQMVKQGHGGSIIGVSSISALGGGSRQVHYTPTKAGMLSLMQSTACALGKYQIRCNALLPGTIQTQVNQEDLSDPAKRSYMESRVPLGRLGVPKDLGGPAVFLASDMSSYVSGAQLLVDGGFFVNLQ